VRLALKPLATVQALETPDKPRLVRGLFFLLSAFIVPALTLAGLPALSVANAHHRIHLGKSSLPPNVAPARGPPLWELE
jgi:hypothetical protein